MPPTPKSKWPLKIIILKAVARKAIVSCTLPLNTIFWPPHHSLVHYHLPPPTHPHPSLSKISVAIPPTINKLPHILLPAKHLQKDQT